MKSFRQFVAESTEFADLKPQTGQWKKIPVPLMNKAKHEPPDNIDMELFRLLDRTYEYVGGHIDFKKPSDLPANHTIWYAVDMDGNDKPDAVIVGKETQYGVKQTAMGTDGTPGAIKATLDRMVKMVKGPGTYAEMSDAIMHIMIARYRVPCVNDQAVVEKVIGKSVDWIGPHPQGKYPGYNGFYRRMLGGAVHMKILLGTPKNV